MSVAMARYVIGAEFAWSPPRHTASALTDSMAQPPRRKAPRA